MRGTGRRSRAHDFMLHCIILIAALVPVAAQGATEADCRVCHGVNTAVQHHALGTARGWTCTTSNCHAYNSKGTIVTTRDCTVCHGAAYSHPLAHQKITKPADCAACHTADVPGLHPIGGCNGCHANADPVVHRAISSAKAGTAVSCTTCHLNLNHLAQHDKVVAAPVCLSCHNLGVVSEHTSRTSTCATCHSSTNTAVQQTIAAGKAGTVVDCIGCHGSADHLQQHDRAVTAAACGTCHTLGVVGEHTSRTSTCSTCHSSTNAMVQQTITAGKTGTTVDCTNCHGGLNHVQQHDKAITAPGCATCHTKSVLDEHLTRHSTCSTCHSSTRVAVQDAIAKGKAGTAVDCVTCHGNYDHPTAHVNRVLQPYADCSQCHNVNVTTLHADRGFACAACHSSSNATIAAVVAKGMAGTTVYCADCHTVFGNHEKQHDMVVLPSATGFVKTHETSTPKSYCIGCHTSTNATIAKVITDGMAGKQQQCNACHAVALPNQPPAANAGADATASVGVAVAFSGAASKDTDGTITSYAWNFGDGTSGTGVTVSHAYAAAGTYTATLTVTDDDGAKASDTAIVTVVATPVSTSVFADQALAISGLSSATAAEGTVTKTDITAKLRDAVTSDRYLIQTGRTTAAVAVKVNRDALAQKSVKLRIYVSSIPSSQSVRIYAYNTDSTTPNATAYADFTVSGTGWKELDVTALAAKMNNFGWMKFRITTRTSSFYIGEGAFLLQ